MVASSEVLDGHGHRQVLDADPGSGSAQVLYESCRTRITRMHRDGVGVILKEALGPDGAARCRHEADILGRLSGLDGVPRLLPADPWQAPSALLIGDSSSESLARVLDDEPLDGRPAVERALDIAAQLSRILAGVHRLGVVHKDINPANIVISSADGRVTLIDFELGTVVAEERPDFTHLSEVSGTLPYLAPEQTGRMGRPLDRRADLYALGATLYELVTGRPPFDADDPLQLIHDHLARLPVPPDQLNPAAPGVLSRILLQLLEKEPDRRYQSAEGLAHDLARLRTRPTRSTLPAQGGSRDGDPDGTDVDFPLGERDFPQRLIPPSRLVGRDVEIERLRAALAAAVAGRGSAVLVAGAPGVGKTALIDELRPAVTSAGGWFVSGKFDQLRRDLAADGVYQAFRALGRLLLAEPEATLAAHRERLLAALGPNAGLIASVSPEFTALLGTSPETPTIATGEIASRLAQGAVDLLGAVASPSCPVVVVLDDVQWAASTPLGVLDAMLTGQNLPGLLLVAAYRDAEVDAAHPLAALQQRWERLGVTPAALHLANLAPGDVGGLLAEMLRLDPARAGDLAAVLRARTGGNPYDTVELVNALRQDGVLVPGDTGWTWDEAAVRQFVGRGEVLALLQARIDRLAAPTGELLTAMACLGGDVDLPLLSAATGLTRDVLQARLSPALQEGLLVQSQGGQAVRFRHDRVQQAAHALIDDDDRKQLHLQVARRLAAVPEVATMAAEQYLPVAECLDDVAEQHRVAALFEDAGSRLLVVNPPAAQRYLGAAMALLLSPGVAAEPRRLGSVEIGWHRALCNDGRREQADDVFRSIVARHPDPLDRVDATGVQIVSLFGRLRVGEALDLGRSMLRELGVAVPEGEQVALEVGAGLGALAGWSAQADVATDLARPDVTDPYVLAAARLVIRLTPVAFVGDQQLYAWLTLEVWRLWVDHGPCDALIGPLSGPAFVAAALGQHRVAYDVARHAVGVGEARRYEPGTSQARMTFTLSSCHWFEPVENSVTQARAAREQLVRHGDLEYATYACAAAAQPLLEFAPTLEGYLVDVDSALALAARSGGAVVTVHLLPYRQLARALCGRTRSVDTFTDDSFDEPAHLAAAEQAGFGALFLHVARALAAALFGRTGDLIAHAALARRDLGAMPGLFLDSTVHLLGALAAAEQVRSAAPQARDAREAALAELGQCRAWLAARAQDCPANFGHVRCWVDAERAWATGDHQAALQGFDEALEQVAGRQRPWHHALISERAAGLHLQLGLRQTARLLLARARDRYEEWGATAKVTQLDAEHPGLDAAWLRPGEAALRRSPGRGGTIGRATTVTSGTGLGLAARGGSVSVASRSIDLLAVVSASQALSTETNLERLRVRVAEVLSAVAGATSVRLLLRNRDSHGWYLPDGGANAAVALDGAAMGKLLPVSAFRYVERTLEPLMVANTALDDRFRSDPYLSGVKVCSLLVVPVLSQGEPRAVLVLENRLSGGVFTPDRLDAVLLIAGQLAICLDNALAERFRSVVQRSSDLTAVCDRSGRISYVSAAALEMLGIEDAGLAGRSVGDLVHPDDRADLARHLTDLAKTWECRVLRRDGSALWVQVTLTDLLADPAVAGIVLHLRDITERRRLENELRHAQKLESVGQLAAGIAHEINTPVQFVSNNLAFLSEAFTSLAEVVQAYRQVSGSPDPAAAAQAAEQLSDRLDVPFLIEEAPGAVAQSQEGMSRVATIVRAMKVFGYSSAENMATADLNEAILNTLVVATSEIKYVADVVTELGDLPPVWCVLGDINQVVLNLVVNAAHAIGEAMDGGAGRGTITVRTRCVGDDAVIEVQDTGAGIPDEIADRVFEQFFTTKPVGSGTGQGLALAYTLVHDHHQGAIGFTSKVGVGTTFTVRIPMRDRSAPPAQATL